MFVLYRGFFCLLLTLCMLGGISSPLWAANKVITLPSGDPGDEYEACMNLTRKSPAEALQSAEKWLQVGGGAAAKHCQAAALFHLKKYTQAASILEDLVDASPDHLRAGLLAQAAEAWSFAEDLDKAFVLQTRALSLAPEDVDIRIDRAITLGEMAQYWEALDDLNAAYELAPNRLDILLLRAATQRNLKAYDLAMGDIDRVLENDPGNPEALVERGLIFAGLGDNKAARKDWRQVSQTAPDSLAAAQADFFLENYPAKDAQ